MLESAVGPIPRPGEPSCFNCLGGFFFGMEVHRKNGEIQPKMWGKIGNEMLMKDLWTNPVKTQKLSKQATAQLNRKLQFFQSGPSNSPEKPNVPSN